MIAFDRAGHGPKLLLVHGLGGERHVWEPLWPALTARFDTMAVDLPGFGASPEHPGDVSPKGLAEQLHAHLDLHDFAGAHVVGNSLGGWVALELAGRGAVRGVTALCPAGFWERTQGPLPPGRRRLLQLARPLVAPAFAVPSFRRSALQGVMTHPERLDRRAATRIATAYAGSAGYVRVQTAMRAHRFEGNPDVPVTLAWADHDRLVGPERVPFTPTRTVTLHDAGHVPMWDATEAVLRLVLEDA